MDQNADNLREVIFELAEAKREYSEALQSKGVVIESTYEELVQGAATPQQIEELEHADFVKSIRPVRPPILYQPVSEGVGVIQANLAAQNGITGKGVKVAVIDGGFDTTNKQIAPNVKEYKSFRTRVRADIEDVKHGTAVAEIIVDVAPDAELYLYAVGTTVEFLNALDYAVMRGVKVVSISLGWNNMGPYDGTSRLSKALDEARQKGVLPVVAAGNFARSHWAGAFTDTDGDDWHEFAANSKLNRISLSFGDFVSIYLSWNDWPTTCQDYDLYLYDSNLREVSRSTGRQRCSRSPTEEIDFLSYSRGTYYIAIKKANATLGSNLDLFVYGVRDLGYYVEKGSIPNLADAQGALTVGAVDWATGALETFSSRGPTADGRMKPDVVAPDGVSTTSYAPRKFFGTSASTPHIAGSAALIIQANPSLPVDELVNILENGSLDLGSPGKDNLYGSGRVRVSFASLSVKPAVASLFIDGVRYDANRLPAVMIWSPGTVHRLRVSEVNISGADTRFSMKQWTDNNALMPASQDVVVRYDGGPRIIAAEFRTQHLLLVVSPYGESKGGGWYDHNTTAAFSVVSPYDHGNLTRRVFREWAGQTDSRSPAGSIAMISPKTVVATWDTQYYLSIDSSYGQPVGEGWHYKGDTAGVSTQQIVDQGNMTRRLFSSWAGDLQSTQTSASIRMDSPKKAVAEWRTQYYLTVASAYGAAKGEGWYDRGARGAFTVEAELDHGNQTRRVLLGWRGDINTNSPSGSILVTEPKRVSAEWKTQYFVQVLSSFGSTVGTGWYDVGSRAEFLVDQIVDHGNYTRQSFQSWTGDSATKTPAAYVVVSSPKKVSAVWTKQYYLAVNSGGGETIGEGWYNHNSSTTVSATSPSGVVPDKSRLLFAGWTGDVASESTTISLKMSQPRVVNANWRLQFYLQIAHHEGSVDQQSQWADEGTTIVINANPVLNQIANVSRLVFAGWSGSVTSLNPRVNVLLDQPKSLGTNWKKQFYLSIASPYGKPSGEGWHEENSTATVFLASPVGFLVQQRFARWTGDFASTSLEADVVMDSPKTLIAEWTTDYTQLLVVAGSMVGVLGGVLVLRMQKHGRKIA